jgi:hypothetical protein
VRTVRRAFPERMVSPVFPVSPVLPVKTVKTVRLERRVPMATRDPRDSQDLQARRGLKDPPGWTVTREMKEPLVKTAPPATQGPRDRLVPPVFPVMMVLQGRLVLTVLLACLEPLASPDFRA